MIKNDLIKQIDDLDLNDKLLLIENIWDSIAAANNEFPFPEWQKSELDKRVKEFKNSNYSLHDYMDVHTNLRKSNT